MPQGTSAASSRVLFLTRYADNGASSRLRFYALAEPLADHGLSVEVRPFFSSAYLERHYQRRGRLGHAIFAYWRRLRDLIDVRSFDAIVVEKELLPYLPYALEALLLKRARSVLTDHDDALWVQYRHHSLVRDKIDRLMRRSDAIMVGSTHLLERARELNTHTSLIPTCLDPSRYSVKRTEAHTSTRLKPPLIGWIGTPMTSHYLRVVAPALQRLARRRPVHFCAIGAGDDVSLPGVLVRRKPWNLQTEGADLAELDIGIMPLDDDPFSRAKCSYKLLQYMACGLPTVASPVGENRNVVVHDETGYLANDLEDWEHHLDRLCDDVELRQRLGAAGRARVEARYSVDYAVAAVAKTLHETIAESRGCNPSDSTQPASPLAS